jgi:predicted Rdx family selenoprotein
VSLKNEVERELGVPVRVRAGAPGSMNIFVNGEQIYSLKQAGHAPSAMELINLIRAKAPA